MKKMKLLLVLGMFSSMMGGMLAQGPHAYYSDIVLSAEGHPVPGASVLVYKTGTEDKHPARIRRTPLHVAKSEGFPSCSCGRHCS